MVRAICDAFVMEVPMLSKRLDQSLANNDLASAMRAAHTMKSCLRHVAPPEDVAVAAWIESETKAGRTPDEPSVHQLREIGDRWTFELRNWLKTATTVR
jgi:HPt (histidine-containing phosphotransfer) domain-containing protein